MFRRAVYLQPIRPGHTSIVRWPARCLPSPSGAARAATVATDVDASRTGGVSFQGSPPPAGTTPMSKSGVSTTRRATAATASNGATTDGTLSTAEVIGVTEAAEGGGDSSTRHYWVVDSAEEAGGMKFVARHGGSRSIEAKLIQRAEAVLAMVLPYGFPDSVHHPYTAYASWQFTGMAASAAAGVMSTQALLYAMGLGAGALPLAATLNWVIKDGLGQLGGVAFSSLVNTRFDANPKLWRTVAAVSLDASMVLELMSPLAPAYFLPIASFANMGKNVSFLAASASRAAIHNVLSLKGNLADVTAKSGAQTILACMAGTGTGVAFSALLGSEFQAIVPACLCLSAVHLGANYMSMRRLGIPTFNFQRLELVADAMFDSGGNREMLTPGDVSERENVVEYAVRGKFGLDSSPVVAVGSRLEEAVRGWGELEGLCQACQGLPFILSVRGDLSLGTGEVHVLLLEGCRARDVLAGTYVALIAKRLLVERGLHRSPGRRRAGALRRLGCEKLAPTGEILPEVIEEALRQGASLLASPPSPSSSPASPVEALAVQGTTEEGTEHPALHRQEGDYAEAASLGNTIATELSARAKRSGWNTSVLFLEKAGAVRLRLVRQPPKMQRNFAGWHGGRVK